MVDLLFLGSLACAASTKADMVALVTSNSQASSKFCRSIEKTLIWYPTRLIKFGHRRNGTKKRVCLESVVGSIASYALRRRIQYNRYCGISRSITENSPQLGKISTMAVFLEIAFLAAPVS